MKLENGELSQFAKTAEGISYAFYDIRKNSDALDDLSRVVAKLDSDTLTTAELQESAHARLAERVARIEDRLDVVGRQIKGHDVGIIDIERRAIESDQFARQVHTTASGNSVAVNTLARKLEESVDPLWEPVDKVDVGCTCGPCVVHASPDEKWRETLMEHPAWYAYAGKMGDPCWNDPSKRCYPPNNTCATCVPVEEYTLGTSGEKLTGPFDPTPCEEWWYSLPLLMWQYNPAWDAAQTRNTTSPLHVLLAETPPCDACPCAVCDDARHTLSTYLHSDPTPGEEWWYNYVWARWDYNPNWDDHVPECSPALACQECHPFDERDRILCGGMSLTARSDCPCSRCVQDQSHLARFRKTFAAWLA